MPKIRGIKPETWTDENFVDLTPLARLLYIGMWNYACDNGHLEDRSKQIKMRVLPADDCNVAELLRELEEKGRIHRNDGVIHIPTLGDHQRIDKRFFTTCEVAGCERPDPENGNPQRKTRRAHDEPTPRPPREHVEDTTMKRASTPGDGDGDGDGDTSAVASDEPTTTAQTLVAEWIDHCPSKPPSRVVGQVARELKLLLDDGIEVPTVRQGLAGWARRSLHPSTLASVVHEAQKNPVLPTVVDDESALPPVEQSWMRRRSS